jgi:copper chaperone CopZ
MATLVFIVPNISWGPNERTVPAILTALDGVRSVNLDIQARQVSVDFDEALVDADRMWQILLDEDFAVESVTSA